MVPCFPVKTRRDSGSTKASYPPKPRKAKLPFHEDLFDSDSIEALRGFTSGNRECLDASITRQITKRFPFFLRLGIERVRELQNIGVVSGRYYVDLKIRMVQNYP